VGLQDTETPTEKTLRGSPFRLLPPLVPVLEPHDFLDVQPIFARPAVLCDPVDQHRDLWHGGIHAVEQAQFERHRYFREAPCPIPLDLAVFDLLRPGDDFSQPLALDGGRDPVVVQLLHWIAAHCTR
jgi:hypothetical protein